VKNGKREWEWSILSPHHHFFSIIGGNDSHILCTIFIKKKFDTNERNFYCKGSSNTTQRPAVASPFALFSISNFLPSKVVVSIMTAYNFTKNKSFVHQKLLFSLLLRILSAKDG
jgi:hypothetical protein